MFQEFVIHLLLLWQALLQKKLRYLTRYLCKIPEYVISYIILLKLQIYLHSWESTERDIIKHNFWNQFLLISELFFIIGPRYYEEIHKRCSRTVSSDLKQSSSSKGSKYNLKRATAIQPSLKMITASINTSERMNFLFQTLKVNLEVITVDDKTLKE